MIFETIVTTSNAAGEVHIAPFGIQWQQDMVLISPYRPSQTLENILNNQCAVLNLTDDVRVFAAAVAKKASFASVAVMAGQGHRLANALVHHGLRLHHVVEDAVRPTLWMQVVETEQHGLFKGFNRAQAAVVELAVLTSRLNLLPMEKIQQEMQYLQIAIDKTAGPNELEAWQWLQDRIYTYQTQQSGLQQA